MTDYTKTTDFTSKDSLPSGDSGKIIRGAEFGTEFDNIETAVNSKSNKENPSFTGNITVTGTVDGRDISADGTKLDTIETSADVTDTANVTAAGAVMDSELTDITAVKALNQGVATTDSPTFAAVTSTGNVTVGGTVDGRDVAADGTKLDTVETNADVTDTTNVTAAGALMDSEVTNLDQVKAFDSADYATAAQGTTADNALPKTGGAMTGAITTNSTFDGRDVATDGTKLDGIEALADVTDTANVTAAGALMDSELTSEAAVKALNQGVATTDSPTFAGATVNGTVEFDGLSGTGAVTVTDILDQDDMSGNSATALATQQSIKSYVDSQVATSDTLAEVLANGNTTGGTDVAFGDNDKAIFGAGSDLQIYHDGSGSYIDDQGTGPIRIRSGVGGALRFQDLDGDDLINATSNGAVTLYHNNSAKLATSSTGIDVTGVITTDGMTTSADINFGDNDKAIFGAGNDLQIYHDGTHSRVDDTGTGKLILRGNDAVEIHKYTGEYMITAAADGAVTLYHDDSSKLATTSTGIDVTGTATMDAATVQTTGSTTAVLTLNNADGNGTLSQINLGYTADPDHGNISYTGDMIFTAGAAERMRIDSSGNVGIGVVPSSPLHVNVGTNQNLEIDSAGSELRLSAVNDARSTNPAIRFQAESYKFYGAGGVGPRATIDSSGQVGIGTNSPGTTLDVIGPLRSFVSGGTPIVYLSNGATQHSIQNTSGAFTFFNDGTERMRLDASGNLLVGTTDSNVTNNSGPASQAGINIGTAGIKGLIASARYQGPPLALNRLNNDGSIAEFSKDGATVGSIGYGGGGILYNAASNYGLKFYDAGGSNIVHPATTAGGDKDASVSLGYADSRFKDLYLSGFINVGNDIRMNQTNPRIDYDNGSSGSLRFFSTSANTERMRLDSSGNLLVGTTATPSKAGLAVGSTTTGKNISVFSSSNGNNGIISIYQSSGAEEGQLYAGAGNINFFGTSTVKVVASTNGVQLTSGATSWTAISDERSKDIIEPITNAVQKVSTLRSVIGKYKTDAEESRRAFLIAQDVQAVLPEAVDATNENELGIKYTETIPLLVAAIKEQTEIINDLRARVAQLEGAN